MDNTFKEQIRKNKVLDNQSTRYSVINIRNFSGKTKIGVSVKGKTYGWIELNIIGVEGNVEVSYAGIKLLTCQQSTRVRIPIVFVKGEFITINGGCEDILMGLFGATWTVVNNEHYLPYNRFVVDCHYSNKQYLYSNVDHYIARNYTESFNLDNVVFMDEYTHDSQVFVASLLKNENTVYLYTNENNNPVEIPVLGNVDNAIFVYNPTLKMWTIIYCYAGQVLFKVYDKEFDLINNGIVCDVKSGNCSIVPSIGSHSQMFGVVDGDVIKLYYVRNELIFEQLREFSGCNVRIFEGDDYNCVVVFDGYDAVVISFKLDVSLSRGDMMTDISTNVIHNLIDYMIIDNVHIVKSIAGECSMLEELV